MEISAKDKKLLVYLLAIVIIAGAYFFGARPLLDKQMKYADEVEQLRQQVDHYNEIYTNSAEYENRIAEAQVTYNETVNKFFGGLNQDNTIMMIKDLEDASDVWIARVSFQDGTVVFGGENIAEEDIGEESADTTDEGTEPTASTVISGLRQDLNIDYAAKYNDFKRFIEYVQNYDERLFITSINASYGVDTGLVGGSIVLSQFAVTGTDKEYEAPDLSNVHIGNDMIFKSGSSLLAPVQESNIEMETVDNAELEENSVENSDAEENQGQENDSIDNTEVVELEDTDNPGRRRPAS